MTGAIPCHPDAHKSLLKGSSRSPSRTPGWGLPPGVRQGYRGASEPGRLHQGQEALVVAELSRTSPSGLWQPVFDAAKALAGATTSNRCRSGYAGSPERSAFPFTRLLILEVDKRFAVPVQEINMAHL